MLKKTFFAIFFGIIMIISYLGFTAYAEDTVFTAEETELASEFDADDTEDETAVYVSSLGDDSNSGRNSSYPVKTLSKVGEIISSDNKIVTVYVVGKYESQHDGANLTKAPVIVTLGTSGREITVTSYDETQQSEFNMTAYKPDETAASGFDTSKVWILRLVLSGDVKFENIKIVAGSNDACIATNGHKLTLENDVVTDTRVAGSDAILRIATADFTNSSGESISNINGSGVNVRSYMGLQNGGNRFEGSSTINVADGATAKIWIARANNSSNTTINGSVYINVKNGGNVSDISMLTEDNSGVANYSGLRYITINEGGKVSGNIYTTGRSKSKSGSLVAATRKGVTVVEINEKNAVGGKILKGKLDVEYDDDSKRIVIYNNDSYVDGQVTDVSSDEFSGAMVLNVSTGALKAVTTTPTKDDSWECSLIGFSYETEHNAVSINGEEAVLLSEFDDVVIPADFFVDGVNTVEFITIPIFTVSFDIGGGILTDAAKDKMQNCNVAEINGIVSGEFPEGFEIELNVSNYRNFIAKEDYTLKGFKDSENDEYTEDTVITVSADKTFILIWEENTYSLTVENGSGDGNYKKNDVVTITADEPEEGKIFIGWTGEGVAFDDAKASTTTFSMPAKDVTVEANYGDTPKYGVTVEIKLERSSGSSFYADPETGYYNAAEIGIQDCDGNVIYTATEVSDIISDEEDNSSILITVELETGTYTLNVIKNGYVPYSGNFIVDEATVISEVKLVAGDIKDSFDAECGDGIVDIDDFIRVLRGFSNNSGKLLQQSVDINEDGVVNVIDLAYIKRNFNSKND